MARIKEEDGMMITIKNHKWFRYFFAGMLIAMLGIAGCNDGDDGATGPAGPAGTSSLEDLLALNPDFLDDLTPLNPVLDLSNTISVDAATGVTTIHFFLTDGNGNGVDVLSDAYELRVYVSELISNADGTNGQSWSQLFNERGTPADDSPMPGTLTLVDADTGEYNYVLDNTLPASDKVTRVTMRARWRQSIDGTRYVFANPVNASYDFLQADPANELADSGADMVTTAACNSCHGDRIGNVGHGGGYTEVETCTHCHNNEYMLTRNGGEGDLAFMTHRIHAAGQFQELEDPEWRDEVLEITYPQDIITCNKCHTADAPNANLSELVPTIANCGSCHADVNFDAGDNHGGGGAVTDEQCTVCHAEGREVLGEDLSPSVVHIRDPLPENVPEYAVTINMTDPVNGTHYEAGEAPEVTVTLAGANTVDYEADPDAEGNTDGVLSEAELYIYGPRANAVPVLATDTITDTTGFVVPPTQGHDLLLTGGVSTDPLVRTDDQGYKYQLLEIPADLPAGTYMVRFEGLDYGTPGDPSVPEYWTASTAVMTFQVGTADVEAKLSGDACTDCHGDTIMHLEGAHPHHAQFDTDGCLACHDLSENYGNYIGNRAHAVHAASATGDLHLSGGLPRNWSEVTYPRPANNCTTCHTNSDSDVPVWRDPNEVACGGCHGTQEDPDPAVYPDVAAEDLMNEAAAAVHMIANGGTFDATTTNPTDPNYMVRQCIVCHGEDRIADTFDSHGLVNFPVTDSNDD
jgi:OmcA/MtrC family decaheme c-type cytochrome